MKPLRASHIISKDREVWFCPYCGVAEDSYSDISVGNYKCRLCRKWMVIDERIDEVYYV